MSANNHPNPPGSIPVLDTGSLPGLSSLVQPLLVPKSLVQQLHALLPACAEHESLCKRPCSVVRAEPAALLCALLLTLSQRSHGTTCSLSGVQNSSNFISIKVCFNAFFIFCDRSECHQNDMEMYRSSFQPPKGNVRYGDLLTNLA